MVKAIFCDFEGVLHPAAAIQGIDLALLATRPALAIERHGLFQWTEHLEAALVDAEKYACDDERAVLIVHSSWRKQPWATNAIFREVLGPLAHRYEGTTDASLPRQESIEVMCERFGIGDRLILDDASAEFNLHTPGLIVTNPLMGVSDPDVLSRVSAWATTRGCAQRQVACA